MSAELRALAPDEARNVLLAGVEEAAQENLLAQAPYSVLKRDLVDVPAPREEQPVAEPGPPTPEGYEPCISGANCEEG